jgi:hypothetical protein
MKERYDALFVINQDQSPDSLVTLCKQNRFQSLVFLTTHHLFPFEKQVLKKVSADVKILTFSDLLTENDMCTCDEIATQILQAEEGERVKDYANRFYSLSRKEKNRIVQEKILELYQFSNIYYLPGLGIDEIIWSNFGRSLKIPGSPVFKVSQKIFSLGNRIYSKVTRINEKREISLIQNDGKTYVFLSQLKRLRIISNIKVQTVIKKNSEFEKFQHIPDNETIFCTTIHDYGSNRQNLSGKLLVFQDGYIPSNYPRSYIDMFTDSSFVVRTMYDEMWFKTYSKKTIKPPAFIEREFFISCSPVPKKHILIPLNHAGDWTSLINRSDTDLLVAAIQKIAQKFPQFHFRIRTHPTMNHPAHEGIHSSLRIEQFVRSAHLDNLTTSDQSLNEDIAWADVCLSEYSQVLLDALRMGKIGMSVNLTRRRSFMQDYTDIGFFHATNIEEAITILQEIMDDVENVCARQNRAVIHYNKLLADWLGEEIPQ